MLFKLYYEASPRNADLYIFRRGTVTTVAVATWISSPRSVSAPGRRTEDEKKIVGKNRVGRKKKQDGGPFRPRPREDLGLQPLTRQKILPSVLSGDCPTDHGAARLQRAAHGQAAGPGLHPADGGC